MLEGHFGLQAGAPPSEEHTLIVINGAGDVGSVATQLAAKVFGIKHVVATASREESIAWVKRNHAQYVVSLVHPIPAPVEFGAAAFGKALSLHYELMFARGLNGHDLTTQGRSLNGAYKLIDEGVLQSIVTRREVLSGGERAGGAPGGREREGDREDPVLGPRQVRVKCHIW
jgi:NADPH2:quinone reductase